MKLAESTLLATIAVSAIVGSCSVIFLIPPLIEPTARADRSSHNSELDPPLGSNCTHLISLSDQAVVPILARTPPTTSRKETLLILAETCSGCSLHAISPTDLRLSEFRAVVFIYGASRTQIENSVKGRHPHVTLISDVEGRARSQMNATWTPRFALLSPSGSLRKLQRKPGTLKEFLNEP